MTLMEGSPAARHPPTAGRGGQGQRGAAPCAGGWLEGVPGALRLLYLILKELPGSQAGLLSKGEQDVQLTEALTC